MAKLGEQQVMATWKDASVELPEENENVIVALLTETIIGSGKFTREYDYATYDPYMDNGYVDSEGRCWATYNDWPEGQRWWVTHWMSIPKIDDNRNPYLDVYEPEKPTATAQEVAQWSDKELSKYAISLYESGTVGYDLDYIIDNLSFVRTLLKAERRSDASLLARCKSFNIKL